MSPAEEAAVKLIDAAIVNFKKRCTDSILSVADITPAGDEERRAFIMQYRVADDVGKTIAAILMAVKR